MDIPHISKAGVDNIDTLAAIIGKAYRDVAERFNLTPQNCPKHPSNYTAEWVQSDMDRGIVYYMLEMNGKICGSVALEKAEPDTCYLERLSVLPAYRRQGLGTMMVKHIFKKAKALGASSVGIGIIARQHELKQWYMRLGFVENETKSFAHLPFEVTFLSCSLPPIS